ncbi:hypothetical protein DPX16_18850 [Anabarilius grahami]|uniref:Uncharacterized protein n=1 Tax=Anabarilius grahami TaxID=495550 RepID=A0A3N0YLA5_ANAGA|nr:hypothetical protein DPX16_18850 [Anabarilius grahami]
MSTKTWFLHQLGELLRDAWWWRWIALSGRLDNPPPPGGWQRLLQVRAVGRSLLFPAPPVMANPPQPRLPAESSSVPLATHSSTPPRASMAADSAQPCLMAPRIPHSGKGSLTECSYFLLSFGNVTQFVDKERRSAQCFEQLISDMKRIAGPLINLPATNVETQRELNTA